MKQIGRRLVSFLVCLGLLMTLVPPLEVRAEEFSTVYSIKTPEDFLAIANNMDGSYRLDASIDLGMINPIGFSEETGSHFAFSGFLDGNGYSVSYSMNQTPGCSEYGLFSMLDGAEILNLTVNANVNITMEAGESCDIGALAGSISGASSIAEVELSGSLSVTGSGSGSVYAGGVAGGSGGEGVAHTVNSSVDISVCGTEETFVRYAALFSGSNAFNCDVRGSVELIGAVESAVIFASASDCTSTQNIHIDTSRSVSVIGCSSGAKNCISGEYIINTLGETGIWASVCALKANTNSTYEGKITYRALGSGCTITGAEDSDNVTVDAEILVMGGNHSNSRIIGLSNCSDSSMDGSISVNTHGAEGTVEAAGLYGSTRCSFRGEISAQTGYRLRVYGAEEGTDCSVNASLYANGGDNAYCYGLYKITRGNFDGSVYAASVHSFASAYGGSKGTHNIIAADVEAHSTESAPSAHGVSGDNCSFHGSVKSDIYATGISGKNTIGQGSISGSACYAISGGDHSYFSGSIHSTNGAEAFDKRASSSNCAVKASIVIDGTDRAYVATYGGFFEGSVIAHSQNGLVEIYGEEGSISHGASGFSSTLSRLVEEYDEYYVYWHGYEGYCDRSNNHTEKFRYESGYWGSHYEKIVAYSYITNKYESLDAIDWSESGIDPYEEAVIPDSEPTSYTIRLVSPNGAVVPGAKLLFNGGSYVSDASGCVFVENGPAVISPLEVQEKKDSGEYETVMRRTAFYPIPNHVNDLRIHYDFDFDLNLDFVAYADSENAKGQASGGEIKIGSLTFPIFKLPISLDVEKTLFDHLPIKASYDAEKGTVKSIIGLENAPGNIGTIAGRNAFDNLFEKAKNMVQNAKTPEGREAAEAVLKNAEKNHNANVFTSGWTFQVAGYAESQLTRGTSPKIIGGGVLLKGEYEYRQIYHLIPWAPAAYVSWAFNGGVDADLAFTDPKEPSIETAFHVNMAGTVDPKISLTGVLGMGVRTARTYIEAGVKGSLDSSIQVPFENVNDSITARLTGSVVGEARLLAFSYAVEHEFGSVPIWPRGNSGSTEGSSTGGEVTYALNRAVYDALSGGEYSIVPRSYAQGPAARSIIESDGYVGLSGSSYPHAEVGLYPLENGNYLLLYTDDSLSRGDADRSALRACIGTEVEGNLTWGEAVTIEDDGTGDYGFQAVASGNCVAVVWQDANRTFGNGEDLAVSDMASAIVLSQTILDCSGETAVPGEIGTAANQGSYPYNLSLSYDGENLRTAWVTTGNPDPTVYMEDEIETLWYSEGFGVEGIPVQEETDRISGVALVYDNLLWAVGQDGKMTLRSRISDGTITDVDNGNIAALQSNGWRFCYTKDGALYRGDNSWSGVYKADSGDGYANILRLSADGSVYAAQSDMETSQICILEGGKALPIGEYAGFLSSWDAANGHIVTVLRTGFTAEDTASFQSGNREEIVSMEIGAPVFDNATVTPNGRTEMTVNVSNDGYHPIESLHISVVADDGTVLMEEDEGCYIAPCENGDVDFGFSLPEGFMPQNVTVTVGEQAHTVTLGGTNLAVSAEWSANNAKGIRATVSNTGTLEATGTVTLTDEGGNVMDAREVTVAPGCTEDLWLAFEDYYREDADLAVTLSGVENELAEYDNTASVAVRPVEARAIRTTASITLNLGETGKIEVRTIPEGALLPELRYTSGDEAIARVEENRTVLGVAPGETSITAVDDAGNTYTTTVTVREEKTEHIHHYEAVVTDPTCTEGGYTTHTCACGDSYRDSEADALGHSYENGSCQACGETDPNWTEPSEPSEPSVPTEPAEPEIIRIYGDNRFTTAFAVADQMKENLGIQKFEAVIVASGTNFADALSGSYLAAVKNAPILLSFNDRYNKLAKDYIWENLTPGGTVYILGGTAAVPASMETGLENFNIKRLAGADRFGTNLAILEEAGIGGKDILICTGLSFADSLSASASELPILLVWNKLTDAQKAFLEGLGGNKLYVIGGESAVSEGMRKQVSAYGTTERIGGANRFETSVNIARKFFNNPDSAVLAYAWNYPDGLCGGALAATMDAPLILTMANYESAAATYVYENAIQTGTILGGESLIPDEGVRLIFGLDADTRITRK